MPVERVPDTDLEYILICFDAQARERSDDPEGVMSRRAMDALQGEPVTDVFLMSHGWLGDIPAAKAQYTNWIGAMASNADDLQRMRQLRPGFRPLLVGLHWPSLPFGEEQLGGGGPASFSAPAAAGSAEPSQAGSPVEPLIREYAERLADSPAALSALRTIFSAAMDDIAPSRLSDEVVQAYQVLDREAHLGSGGVAASPADDREPFDPNATYRAAEEEMVSFGGIGGGGLLAPLRTLSFWKMKARAAQFGSQAGFSLLRELQSAAAPGVRFHLMGHSFGCVVMSATLAGPDAESELVRPLDSVALLQGALSLWSYAADIPHAPGTPGYFHRIISDRRVAGPLITTQSEFDTAVGRLYPLAAGAARQVHFAPGELPKYGALGTFGVRGPGPQIVDLSILPPDGDYGFEPGKVYNLESSQVIRNGGPPSGAHSDLAHPEVSHAVWQAAMCGLR